jgi:hypothetical protein
MTLQLSSLEITTVAILRPSVPALMVTVKVVEPLVGMVKFGKIPPITEEPSYSHGDLILEIYEI